MDMLWFVIWIVIAAVILGLLKRVWVALAMGVLGLKPRILDEKVLAVTVKECTAQFLVQCRNIHPDCLSEEEKRMMLDDMEIYTKFVIESYVQNYLMAK
jgi:hypothetical protein